MKRQLILLALLLKLLAILPAFAFEPPKNNRSQIFTATGTIELAFTPGDHADDIIAAAIGNARRQILVQAFSFTHKKIARALIASKRNGVDVQIIADAKQAERIQNSAIPQLAAGGVPIYLDARHESAHNKIMVIDSGTPQAVVITGSYNFTHAAQYTNAENVLLIRGNPSLSDAYLRNWQQHRTHALPYRKPPSRIK